jgi:hypothetical protein
VSLLFQPSYISAVAILLSISLPKDAREQEGFVKKKYRFGQFF